MNRVELARKLIREYPFDAGALSGLGEQFKYYYDGERPDSFNVLDAEILAKSFCYLIDIVDSEPGGSSLGYSKMFGHPHMPADWKKPASWKKHDFWLQLNFEQLKSFDREDRFPDTGIAWIFQHRDEGECIIVYSDAPISDLVVRDDIRALEDATEEPVAFEAGFIFYVGYDTYDYMEICKFIPDELKHKLEELLDARMMNSDPDTRLFGRPHYWQGEDVYGEDYLDEYEDDDELNEQGADADDRNSRVLLFHGSLDDTSIHIWVPAEDLRNGKFDSAWETFSGT